MQKRTSKIKVAALAVNALLIVGLAGSSGYLYIDNRELREQATLSTAEKNKRLVSEINGVFDLPDEEPVVAIVSDKDQFKKEYPTFENAETGDYLLFFRKARLNVLYRQTEKKVVKTANVIVPITLELVGSQAAVDAKALALEQFGKQLTVTKTVKEGITQAFVFDVDNDQQSEVESIAKQLKYELGSTLPTSFTPGEQTEVVVFATDASIAVEE